MDERTLPLVATRRDCEEACLRESRFVCRSARYDTKALDCKLSSSDKRLRPEAFVDAPSHVEYLENQCVGLGNRYKFNQLKVKLKQFSKRQQHVLVRNGSGYVSSLS